VRLELAETLPPVRADRMLLGRALENLVRNAFEAMPDGGTVTISTARRAAGVRLAVRDSGPGMDALTRERATDDFSPPRHRAAAWGSPSRGASRWRTAAS
jgi:signal transduction histidine kinase